jgi:hypothetical protein
MRSFLFLGLIALMSGAAAAQEPRSDAGPREADYYDHLTYYCTRGMVATQFTVARSRATRRRQIVSTRFTWIPAERDTASLIATYERTDGRGPVGDPASLAIGLRATMDSMSFSRIEIVPAGPDGAAGPGMAPMTIGRELVNGYWPDRATWPSLFLLGSPVETAALRRMVQAGAARATLIETLPGRPDRIVSTGRVDAATLDEARQAFAALWPTLERMARNPRVRCAPGGQAPPAPPPD